MEKAAEQGNVDAQYSLAVHCHQDEGLTKDNEKAVYWFKKAAEQGDERAKAMLSSLERVGEGGAVYKIF
jgi:TPR repeat protein